MNTPSYHDLHIQTAMIERTSISDLPYGLEVVCNRVGGWSLCEGQKVLASEYGDAESWLVLDVAGHMIVDSRRRTH